ncbi:MAG: hypothetical protein OEW18_15235, partial [Candidatus Aminicenantes bacterium]|nr:hypothetical protein [Candidatus Aminicenantes bacterium]
MQTKKVSLMMALVVAALAEMSGQMVSAQSVEKVMADYFKAMGGLENLKAWKGMKGEGKYVMAAAGAPEVPFTVWYKAPDKQRMEMDIQGQTAIYASDGKNPWFCDPTRGVLEPTHLPEDQARDARNHADEYPFIDYEKK